MKRYRRPALDPRRSADFEYPSQPQLSRGNPVKNMLSQPDGI